MAPSPTSGLVALTLAALAAFAPNIADAQTVQRGRHDGAQEARIALASPLPGAPVSSGFGLRRHPILGTTMMHEGIDLAAPDGTPILAAAGGSVVEARYEPGYGNFVRVRHGPTLETLYGHMSRVSAEPGTRVARGDVIGYVGSTGLANGPHLHFEIREHGAPIDPAGSAAAFALPSSPKRTPPVEIMRGGRSEAAIGGPKPRPISGVVVVRGGRR